MAKKNESTMTKTADVAPRIRLRGHGEFRHDLFKSDVRKMIKNASFKKGVVEPVELEHTHVFHTFDSRGKAQQYSSTTGGHFHEVSWRTTPEGDLVATCGPALRVVTKKKARGGSKRVVEAVQWSDHDDGAIRDEHKHEWSYVHSEFLSEAKLQQTREQTRGAVAGAMAVSRVAEPVADSGGGSTKEEVDGTEFQTDDD